MLKIWRLLLLSSAPLVVIASPIANGEPKATAPNTQSEPDPLAQIDLCHAYRQPLWQPLPNLVANTIDIQADDVELQGTQSAEFNGNVDINTSKMTLRAESALIDKQKGLLHASGPLEYQDKFTKVYSVGLFADLNKNAIQLLGANYQLSDQMGHGGAEKLSVNANGIFLENSSFTTCPGEQPFWLIEADDINLSAKEGWGETESTVLRILDVPVVYIPYFTFPIDDRRKSGLLTPTISPSSKYGLEIAAPIYWNLAPNYDATITPRYMSNQGLQLIGEVRYLTPVHEGLMAFEYLGNDKSEPTLDDRYLMHFRQQSDLDANWRANLDVTNISDDNYLTDLESAYATTTDTQLQRTALLSYLGDNWRANIKLQNFEILGDHTESYAAIPQLAFSRKLTVVDGFYWDLSGEVSHFQNSEKVIDSASRIHLEPKVAYRIEDHAWSFLTETSVLHTYYQQDGDLTGTPFDESVSRTLPKFRLYGKLNFERDTNLFVEDGIQTLEPQLQYLYTPRRDQSNIGLYDTARLQDDFFGLFRDRRFTSVDRVAEANQFTLGATTRVFNTRNDEVFNFSFGQIFYLNDKVKPSEQNLFSEIDDTNYNALLAAETMWHWHRRWYLGAGVQYDTDGQNVVQSHVTLDYKGDNNQLVQLNHRYVRDVSGYTIDQVGMFASLPINESWQLIGSYHRDFEAKRSIESFVGVQYESCCFAIQITGRRQIETDLNSSIGQDDAIFNSSIGFNFVLKGLGSTARSDVQNLLKRGIFAYRRPYFLNN
ncbi:Outer membrane protein Imp, required for envelope biogenesis / Organic solvent tolerance protein precursor [Pseudoalteromonas luteoviolacea B = ATCC 29581]|nr:Outer membrane protein Imp, required for envelope biogenesis / Organic solvent tolerance protein precursor [Pseudoalteromonas luteoviolacea B = ATCC 29581]